MKRFSYVLIYTFICAIILTGQNNAQVYNGDLVLTTQAQVDTFNYTDVNGNLTISESVPRAIYRLTPLNKLKSVTGNLRITGNDSIVSISLNYPRIGGDFEFSYNSGWVYMSQSGLSYVGGSFILRNANPVLRAQHSTEEWYYEFGIDSIGHDFVIDDIGYDENSLPGLVYVGHDVIIKNISNFSVKGFTNLSYVGGDITIADNPYLNNLCAFYNLFTTGTFNGNLITSGNAQNLTKQQVIERGKCTYDYGYDLTISSQYEIDHFKYYSIQGTLTIQESVPGNITNLEGLKVLRVLSGLHIKNNSALQNLNGLDSIRMISGTFITPDEGLEISNNASLNNIDALKNLGYLGYGRPIDILIGGNVIVKNNPMLTNLNGFSGLRVVGILNIENNPALESFCGLYGLFNEGKVYNGLSISGNAINPTPEEIVEQGPCTDNPVSYTAVLLGKNLNPPVLTDASGGAMFVLNGRRDTLHYYIRICELKCPVTSIGLYIFRNGNYFLIKDITSEAVILPGALDAYVHGYWTSSDSLPYGSPLYDLQVGRLAVKVNTTGYPSGEIAGTLYNNIPVHLFANLDGSQEVPPVDPAGSGEGWFTLSGDGDSLYYNVSAYDLSSPVTAAHFHKAGVDSSGPPVKPISFMGDTLSEGWWTNMDANPLTPELVADLLGCYLYVNIHTSNNPAGEIRGQLYKTDEVPTSFMTLLAAENDADENNYSKLSYYTLQEGKQFHNYEGDITGYDGQKNIVDMTIDIGGNVYLLNNSWTSMLYRIRPEQFDFDGSTVLRAKQMGRLRFSPEDIYVAMTNIQFIKGKLYGFDSKTNKLYNINPNNAHVTEIAELSSIGTGTAGFALGADGNVYLLKNIDEKRSEIWKFNKFPSTELTLVTEVPSLGRLNTLSAHPNGNLYSACSENLYEINLSNKTIGVLKDHKITASAMDFDYFTEKQTAASGTIPFTNLDGVTAVGDFTEVPKSYELSQNYPNPFNPGTTIKYALPEAAFVKLVVYNSLGEVVRTLVNDNRSAGYYETVFDAKDLSSGMYIYRLEAGSFVSTAKMILMK